MTTFKGNSESFLNGKMWKCQKFDPYLQNKVVQKLKLSKYDVSKKCAAKLHKKSERFK